MKKIGLIFLLAGSVLLSNSLEKEVAEKDIQNSPVLEETFVLASAKLDTEEESVRSIWLVGGTVNPY